jgi:hypothetical protein
MIGMLHRRFLEAGLELIRCVLSLSPDMVTLTLPHSHLRMADNVFPRLRNIQLERWDLTVGGLQRVFTIVVVRRCLLLVPTIIQ